MQSIDQFGERLRQYDVGLLYFSGHGVQHNGENYLVPIDAKARVPNDIEYNCVKLGRSLALMEGADLKISLALLDACRNNPFPASSKSGGGRGLTIPNNPPGSFVAFSTRAGSVSDDNVTGRNGLFTDELLKHLTTPDMGIRTIMDRTIQGVSQRSAKTQLPGRYDELTGDFVFVTSTAQPGDIALSTLDKTFGRGYSAAKFGITPKQLLDLEWSQLLVADEYKGTEVRYHWGYFPDPWVAGLLPEKDMVASCSQQSGYLCLLFNRQGLFNIAIRLMGDCQNRERILEHFATKYGVKVVKNLSRRTFYQETESLVFHGFSDDVQTVVEFVKKGSPTPAGQDW